MQFSCIKIFQWRIVAQACFSWNIPCSGWPLSGCWSVGAVVRPEPCSEGAALCMRSSCPIQTCPVMQLCFGLQLFWIAFWYLVGNPLIFCPCPQLISLIFLLTNVLIQCVLGLLIGDRKSEFYFVLRDGCVFLLPSVTYASFRKQNIVGVYCFFAMYREGTSKKP